MKKEIMSFYASHPLYSYLPRDFLDTEKAILRKDKELSYVFFLCDGKEEMMEEALLGLFLFYRAAYHKLSITIVSDNEGKAKDFLVSFSFRYPQFREYETLYEKQQAGSLKEEYYPLDDLAISLSSFGGNKEEFYSSFKPSSGRFIFLFCFGHQDYLYGRETLKNLLNNNHKLFDVSSNDNGSLSITDIDSVAKGIMGYYDNTLSDASKTEEDWNEIKDTDQGDENRIMAISLVNKLNLVGLKVTHSDDRKPLTEIIRNFSKKDDPTLYDDLYLNIARQEHLRWESYSLYQGWKPMLKKDVYSEGKYQNKFKERKIHANLISFKGMLELLSDMKKKAKEGCQLKDRDTELIEKDLDIFLASDRILSLGHLGVDE